MTRIGLALGGGGAKGLAHIPMLEAFEELGVRPAHVAGTSMGAVVGVSYCGGLDARGLRRSIEDMTILKSDTLKTISSKKIFKWLDFLAPHFEPGGVVKSERFINFLMGNIAVDTFEELAIPLSVVAADFWKREARVFDAGPLAPAVQASMSIPGVFAPVELDGAVLVDGGGVNPVPFDILPADCDLTVAIDVTGQRAPGDRGLPTVSESVINMFQIMQKTIIDEKLRHTRPDIYIDVESAGVGSLDFHRVETVFAQAEPSKDKLKRALEARLG